MKQTGIVPFVLRLAGDFRSQILMARPRASLDREKVRALLKLTDAQHVFLNHPVGHAK
jgi:hypothetical protein